VHLSEKIQLAHVMPKYDQETNFLIYAYPGVAAFYAEMTDSAPCERVLFDTYLRPGMAILDLGVGGGRTTPYLSRNASRYVGVDYSEEMVRVCKSKFPDLQFEVADASDLSRFADASFDAVVFSFNGLDCLAPDEKRHQCMRECYRVLRKQGVFIFSAHNPRSLFLGLHWDRQRVRTLANKLTGRMRPLFYPAFAALTGARVGFGLVRSVVKAIPRAYRRVPTSAFWRGEGYLVDPTTHGGLLIHCAVPVRKIAELARFHFRLLELTPDGYPHKGREYSTRWYYYAFSKD
jgi:ubiquinone/menaquinone biosynthesis C-methylase UbiE